MKTSLAAVGLYRLAVHPDARGVRRLRDCRCGRVLQGGEPGASGLYPDRGGRGHYNLHVMLRFDLERAMIRGQLDVADLEESWNARFRA